MTGGKASALILGKSMSAFAVSFFLRVPYFFNSFNYSSFLSSASLMPYALISISSLVTGVATGYSTFGASTFGYSTLGASITSCGATIAYFSIFSTISTF
jgi:hypothetical protein